MPTETHDLFLDRNDEDGGIQSWCSCEWSPRRGFATEVEAVEAWDNHCDQVFMAATGG